MEIDGFRPRRERMDANEELLLVEDQEILDIQGMFEILISKPWSTYSLCLIRGCVSLGSGLIGIVIGTIFELS